MKRIEWMLSLGLMLLALFAGNVYAESPREEFKQMVEQLQKSPGDNALREKVIKLAQELKPAPAVPEDAKRRIGRGQAAFELAKSPADFDNAVSEFQAAVSAAPWHADAYYNLGVAQEKAGKPAEAMSNFKLYLLAAPSAKDYSEVEQRIYKLEYAAEQKNKDDVRQAQKMEKLLQKQRWASNLVQWLKENYGGRQERNSSCIILPSGRRCTEQEAQGDNWLSTMASDERSYDLRGENRRFTYRVAGENNDQIQLTVPFWNFLFCGAPTGGEITSVQWSYCGDKDKLKQQLSPEALFEFARSKDGKPWVGSTYFCEPDGSCLRDRYVLEK